jgi:2-polyprenyl-6-methoxyphenol hydroxylase-like FAD-dependent oxidoreductase
MPFVLIIGAGPAGSAAALLLSQAGIEVAIAEQSRFPRDKVCGECVSSLGWSVLERLGLASALLAGGAVALRETVLYAADGTSATLRLPKPMYAVSRRMLDGVMLEAATRAGAQVLQPVRCEQVNIDKPPRVTLRFLDRNTTAQRHADYIILADGKSALPGPKPAATADLGLKAHFAGVNAPADSIGLFALPGHYVGVAPIEGRRFNLALSLPRRRVEAQHNLDALFEQMLAENAALRRQFAGARRVSPWLTSALPRFAVRGDWPPGVIPVGNAAAALEPIGGEGIGLALRSAQLAAHELIDAITARRLPDLTGLRRQFASLWRFRRPSCRAAALYLSSSTLASAGMRLLEANPALGRIALALLGKRDRQSLIA